MAQATRRSFLGTTAGTAAAIALPRLARAAPDDRAAVEAEAKRRHDESLERLRAWIRLPSIAAESRAMNEGCEHMMQLALEAGFTGVKRVDTKGHPSVFGVLDAGAKRTVGLYFMSDVKQADPAEWSSPPFEARLVDKPGFEVNPSGGYNPTSTARDAAVIRAQVAVYERRGLDPLVWPRNAGSYPGYIFTDEPLKLPAGHFGLGHGGGAHAPDEYFVIEPSHPKIAGWDQVVMGYVDYLNELAAIA